MGCLVEEDRRKCRGEGGTSACETAEGRTLYVLEAKLAPNSWCRITDVYPEAELAACYCQWEEAHRAKAELKSLLLGPWKGRFRKKPIRIREISVVAC